MFSRGSYQPLELPSPIFKRTQQKKQTDVHGDAPIVSGLGDVHGHPMYVSRTLKQVEESRRSSKAVASAESSSLWDSAPITKAMWNPHEDQRIIPDDIFGSISSALPQDNSQVLDLTEPEAVRQDFAGCGSRLVKQVEEIGDRFQKCVATGWALKQSHPQTRESSTQQSHALLGLVVDSICERQQAMARWLRQGVPISIESPMRNGTTPRSRVAWDLLTQQECTALAEIICEQYGQEEALKVALGEKDEWLDERIRAAMDGRRR